MAPIADPRVLTLPIWVTSGGQDLPLLANRHHWLAGCGVVIYQGESRKRRSLAGASASWPLGGLTARGELKTSKEKEGEGHG